LSTGLTTSTSEINDSQASTSGSSEVTSPEMETAPTSPMTPTVEEMSKPEEKKSEEEAGPAAPAKVSLFQMDSNYRWRGS